MIGLNRWLIGGVQSPHLDTYSNQEMELNTFHGQLASREWTCILYLNDNYKGGRTYVADGKFLCHDNQKSSAYPRLLFQGIYIHGVSKVRRNDRYTISLWFSSIRNRNDDSSSHLDDNVDDLTTLDEDSWRLSSEN